MPSESSQMPDKFRHRPKQTLKQTRKPNMPIRSGGVLAWPAWVESMAAAAQLSDIFRGSLKQQMLFLSKVPFNQICSCLEMCATPSVPVAGICTQTCRGKLRKCCLWQQNRLGVLLFLQSNSCAFEWRPAKMTVECFSAVLLNQKMFVLHWSLWDLVGHGATAQVICSWQKARL